MHPSPYLDVNVVYNWYVHHMHVVSTYSSARLLARTHAGPHGRTHYFRRVPYCTRSARWWLICRFSCVHQHRRRSLTYGINMSTTTIKVAEAYK